MNIHLQLDFMVDFIFLGLYTPQSVVQSWFIKRPRLNLVEVFNVVRVLMLVTTTVTKMGNEV